MRCPRSVPSLSCLIGWDQKNLETSQRGKLRPWEERGLSPWVGVLKVWSADREALGPDKQVVLQGSAGYVHDKGGPVERMVGKDKAWRERLEHSLGPVSAPATPVPAHLS